MTSCTLIAGTADGIRKIRVRADGSASVDAYELREHAVRGIAVDPFDRERIYVAAGLRGWGLHRSDDGGRTFEQIGFSDYWCWDVIVDRQNPERLLVGTEPPMLWESLDGGETWSDFPAIDSVSSRPNWTFFHPPFHSGHLHGIAICEERPGRIIVGVEHGGLLLTTDQGESWTDVMPGADLHRVEIAPDDPDRVYAGAGHGLFVSHNGGESWSAIEGLRGRYIHGIVIDPVNPRRMLVYVDSRQCPVFLSEDGGESWQPIGAGLPSSRPADPVRLHPASPNTIFYAGDSGDGGTLYVSDDNGSSWRDLELGLPKVWRLENLD